MSEDDLLARLIRRIQSVVDPSLHVGIVAEFLGEKPAAAVVDAVQALMTQVDLPGYRQCYLAVVHALIRRRSLGYKRVEVLYRAAVAADCGPVRLLLLRAPPLVVAGDDEVLPDPELVEVSLGRRKSMARTTDLDLRTKIALDPDPSVVSILLGNPRLTERDVVRIVARRPNLATIIELVAGHGRWSHRNAIQHSVAQNPYTPASVAASMVPFLTGRHLREVARDAALHRAVQETAATVIRWRTERRGLTRRGRVLH